MGKYVWEMPQTFTNPLMVVAEIIGDGRVSPPSDILGTDTETVMCWLHSLYG